jgi:hypothetical protein
MPSSQESYRERARFRELVFKLHQQGMTDGRVSQLLGYYGSCGERDLGLVEHGRSQIISRGEACAVLEQASGAAFRGVTPAPDHMSPPFWTELCRKAR